MSKKSSRNKKGPASNGSNERQQAVSANVAMEKSEELGMEAQILAGDDAFAKIPSPETPPGFTLPTRMVEAYQAAVKVKQVYEDEKAKLDEQQGKLDTKEEEIKSKSAEAESALKAAGQLSKELDDREGRIAKREQDEKDGFKRLLEDERTAWAQEKQDAEKEINVRQEKLEADEAELKKRRRNLALDEEMLKEDKDALQARIEHRAAALAAADRQELAACKASLASAQAIMQALQNDLSQLRSAQWASGGDAETCAARLTELQKAHEQLRDLYAGYPSRQEIARLQTLQGELDSSRDQLDASIREAGSLKTRLSRMAQQSGELESLRDMKESAEAQLKIARDELGKLRKQIEGEENKEGTFPALAKIDNDIDFFQRAPGSSIWPMDKGLPALVKGMQQYFKQEGFDYGIHDLRCFVAGMAMSRLHILQGISGTGKTSLPRLFARFANSGVGKEGIKIVEVQAGWRDRQDLLGYYNAFERTYRQTEFLRALYEANTPRYQDTPYIVILDEMNLSRPEQYFADLLSALEGDSDEGEAKERNLVLMDRPVGDAPRDFIDSRKIRIPPNVWFVGTANHDETTLEFADKTYDRAHVLELPHEPPDDIPGHAHVQPSRLSFSEMQDAFAAALKSHGKEADKAREYFLDYVEPALGDEFGVGIGNRLKKRQIGQFVPVFLAAGGSIGEAIDHLLVTRGLRRIVGLHDTSGEQFRALAKELKAGWVKLGTKDLPSRTIRLLEKEIRDKEPGNTASVW